MSTEYYTVPPIPFEEAKAKLEADNEGWVVTPCLDKYIPECEAHTISKGDGSLWLLRESVDRKAYKGELLSPAGSVWFEVYTKGYPLLPKLMPWIERVLGVRVMNEVGIEWEYDAGLEPYGGASK